MSSNAFSEILPLELELPTNKNAGSAIFIAEGSRDMAN